MPKQRVIVITGASSGIGKAIAEQLSEQGDRVYALARSLTDNESDSESNMQSRQLDVRDPDAVNRVLSAIIQLEKRIDILILAAGFGLAGAVEAMTPDEAQSQMATNFLGVCHVLSPVLRQMREQKSGSVIQIGSVAGFLPIPYQACYSASKAAVSALMKATANEMKPHGIQCMVVQPGDTRTGFTDARVISPATANLPDADRCLRSIERMAADERKGLSADQMAQLIIRRLNRRKIPIQYTPGCLYRLAWFLNRLLPVRVIQRILYEMYAR